MRAKHLNRRHARRLRKYLADRAFSEAQWARQQEERDRQFAADRAYGFAQSEPA